MKIFIGQAVKGENINKLKEESLQVVNLLCGQEHKVYCTLLKDDKWIKNVPAGEKLNYAFTKIDRYDAFLAIVRSEKRSEGMLIELGYALSKNKKLILAINKNVKDSYLKELADEVIEFEDSEDMLNKLKELK